jgi:iron complex outermembrane receptor protein
MKMIRVPRPTKYVGAATRFPIMDIADSPGFRAMVLGMVMVLSSSTTALAQNDSAGRDLSTLDLDDLARVRITSVSRKPEALANASAAVTVISREDIRRSGAISLPEALRLVPGVQVGRIGSREWGISVRGFNDLYSNKLLVLIDGRAVYTPLFAGVFWGVQRVNIDDVERIEVIRGPGATLWGANAVNGVINIITSAAEETRGGAATIKAGSSELGFGSLRYGGGLGRDANVRVYGFGLNQNPAVQTSGDYAHDALRFGQAGFRADWNRPQGNSMTLQGDLFVAAADRRTRVPAPNAQGSTANNEDYAAHGFNLLWRLNHPIAERSGITVQAYFDHSVDDEPGLYNAVSVNTGDIDLQHRFAIGERHDVIWGAGYRVVWDDLEGDFPAHWDPQHRTTHLVSGFFQDDIVLVPSRVALTAGSKFERNEFTGFEVQPNLRLLWTPALSTSLWAAVSRALRTPSRTDEDVEAIAAVVPGPATVAIASRGSHNMESEILVAYELGFRMIPHERVSIDIAGFYQDYDRLRTVSQQPPDLSGPIIISPYKITNWAEGRSYGVETALTLRMSPRWRLRLNYSYLSTRIEVRDNAPPQTFPDVLPEANPEHQASLWSSLDLPHGIELDAITRYVSPLALPGARPDVPNYLTADARLGLRLADRFRLAVVGQDLFDDQHVEFRVNTYSSELRAIRRRVHASLTWLF